MDSEWRAKLYSPSSACETVPFQMLDSDRCEVEIECLHRLTREIAATPHDPETWLSRGQSLRLLGFPELGLGDAYKSRLLIEAALENTSALGTKVAHVFSEKVSTIFMTDPAWEPWKSQLSSPEALQGQVARMLKQLQIQSWTELMEGLLASNCCSDYLNMSKKAVAKFPSDEIFPSELGNAESWFKQRTEILQERVQAGNMTVESMKSTLLNGSVFPTTYPWMTDANLLRSDALFKTIQSEFERSSTNCTLARSTIRDVGHVDPIIERDVFGVVATKNINSGEVVITDSTIAGVIRGIDVRCEKCCGPLTEEITNSCCGVRYCSVSCSRIALETFHPALCGRDFDFLHEAAQSATSTTEFSLETLMLLRVLAASIQEKAAHPLQSSMIGRLTPACGMPDPQLIIFNFEEHIVTPMIILDKLGIDIYSEASYDTWVVHSIRLRLQNNKHGNTLDGLFGTAINPLYSMINHSCSPNVDWRHDDHSSTVTLFAESEIKAGEELFISYIGKALDMGRAERQKKLLPWFGMPCRCKRCEEEISLDG